MIFLVFLVLLVSTIALVCKNKLMMSNKLPTPVEAKTILSQNKAYGVLSTLNRKSYLLGYPYGSIVSFALDEDDRPFFIFSDLSLHTRNILLNDSISLCVTEYGFKSASDSRVSVTGTIKKQSNNLDYYKSKFLKYHPNADWINLPDFRVYCMNEIKDISFVGGFGRANKIKIKDYNSAKCDPFIFYMNDILDYIDQHYYKYILKYLNEKMKLQVIKFKVKNLDSNGINIVYSDTLVRIPFKSSVKTFDDLRLALANLVI